MNYLQVIRTDLSPYQASNFQELEMNALKKFPLLQYRSLQDADLKTPSILITNTHTVLSKLPTKLLAQTRLILHPNSGYDHFEQERQLWENIPVVIGHRIRAQAVAEYTLGCLLQGVSGLPQHVSWHASRTWERKLISDLNVWVFGYGHIGKIVADTLSVLGANITVVDPFITHCPHNLVRSWKEGNLAQAQVVMACASLNETSRHLFNEDFFAHAHEELLLINGARGKLIQEEALRNFLLSHPKAFAFLDVFEKEPFTQNWHHFPQVWKTSHIAGVYSQLDQRIIDFEVEALDAFLHLPEEEFRMKYKRELLQNKLIQGVLI